MADTIDPRDLYSGVDYNVMQWIIERRADLKALPAFAHATDEALDTGILSGFSWPVKINGVKVTKEKFREYSSYLRSNNLNTEAKVDCDFEASRKKTEEYYKDVSKTLLNAKVDYKKAKSAKNAANARIFGWNVARVMVPVATLAAIGGGLTAVGSLLTSSAFATMLGGSVGVGLFGLAAVGTVGYIGYKLVKSAIKWLANKSKAKKAQAIKDKEQRLREFESAEEALSNAKNMKKQRDKTRNKNNAYKVPANRVVKQGSIDSERAEVMRIRSALDALKTGSLDPLKARESSIDSMDFTTVSNYIHNINDMLNSSTPNLTALESDLNTVQSNLAALDPYAGQEEQIAEITNTIAKVRTTLVEPIKAEAESLRGKAQARSDSLSAGFTGAKRTVNSEITRISAKFSQMDAYETTRKRNLSTVSTTSRLDDLKNIAKEPNNADKYTETELADMLTDLSAIDLSGLSSTDARTFSRMITTLTTNINNMKGSDIIDKNRRALQLCKDKITAIEAANAAKIKVERKRIAAENAVNTVKGKINRLATLTTSKDIRTESVASLTDDELKELISLESKISVDYTRAETKITDLQAIIDANEDDLRADTYTKPPFTFDLADIYERRLDDCRDQVQIIKDKIQEAKEEQANRASGIGLENAITAAKNKYASVSSKLTDFENLLLIDDAALKLKSVADLDTYISELDAKNATFSAINWNDLEQAITDAESAFTAAGGTVDSSLRTKIRDTKNDIARVTTALSNYAGRKSSAQNIKTAKETEIATVQDLNDRKDDLMARCSDVATKVSSELPNMADHIADPDKMLTDGTDLVATLNSIHTIQREASALRNDLQTLKTDITNAITTGVVTDSTNITTLNNLVADIQTKLSNIDATLTDLAAYEPLVNARHVRGGGAGGAVTPITEVEFNTIKNNVLARLDTLEEELLGVLDVSTGKYERDELKGTSPHTKIGDKRTKIQNMAYDSYKGKTYDEVKTIAERGLSTLAGEVTLTLSGYRAK